MTCPPTTRAATCSSARSAAVRSASAIGLRLMIASGNARRISCRDAAGSSVTLRTPDNIQIKLGSATTPLVEIVDTSKVRLMVTIADASGKQIVNNKSTVEAGDYLVYGHSLPNNDGHLLALTCR